MTLGSKTLLMLGASLAFWCFVLHWANGLLLLPSFAALEERELMRNVERARKAIGADALALSSKIGDWSLWDDTYEFLESRSQDYVDSNLNAESFATLELDFMVFVDARGQIARIALADAPVAATMTTAAVGAIVTTMPRLLSHADARSSHHGLIRSGDDLLLIASRPIHRSDLTGEPRGTLLAGRILDAAEVARFANLTQLHLRIDRDAPGCATPKIARTDETIACSVALHDVFGRAIAACTVTQPREIHREGEQALRILFLALLASGLLALATTMVGADRFVLRRLRILRETMREITRTGDLTQRVDLQGSDEISDLATNLNEVTQRLRQTQDDFIRADQARTYFLANVSHEVRTPVTALLGFADLLQEPGLSEPQRADFVQTIRRNAQHLLAILNDLLDSAKLESGQMSIERLTVAPTDLLDETVAQAQPMAQKKGLALQLEFDGTMPAAIVTDPTRARQILFNLLGNAIKFTAAGGVRVVARMLADDVLQVQVIDTGIGISAEQMQRLFVPFSQADASTSRQFGGTGLGLALSRQLARQLGGDVTAASEPGRGSTFTVTIATGRPARPTAATKATSSAGAARDAVAAEDARKPLADRRILVVDDAPDNRRLVTYVLHKAGADVVVTENGRAGVDAWQAAAAGACPFDLVIMDMQMPVLDGYAATRELRDRGFTGPVLALTANAMKSDLDRCVAAGCSDYATKPIDRRGLVNRVAGLLPAATAAAVRG